jgi:hypothetical protein
MKMGERHAHKYGFEKPPREFTRKERELLRADPAFAQWLDQLNALNELKQEPEHVQP